MMIEEFESRIRRGDDIEDVLEKYDWKKFEQIIAEIFQKNSFYTKQNFKFKTKRRYEIDVLATKSNRIFCIDCKWWGKGRYKKSGLKNAIESQEKRVKELHKFLKKNPIAKNMLKVTQGYITNPLIVTLHEEDMIKENNTFVVPVWKLNNFILAVENYI